MRVYAASIFFIPEHHTSCHCEVSDAACKFLERIAAVRWPRGQSDGNEKLVWLKRGCQHAGKKLIGGNDARAAKAFNLELCFAGHSNRRHFCRRVCMGATSTDGAAVTNLIVCGMPDCFDDKRMLDCQLRILQNIAPTR